VSITEEEVFAIAQSSESLIAASLAGPHLPREFRNRHAQGRDAMCRSDATYRRSPNPQQARKINAVA
jgi:hypothetical protein